MSKTDAILSGTANVAWNVFQAFNSLIKENESPQPGWAPGPLPKSRERSKPPLGFPRETDSLCPKCVWELRDKVISGKMSIHDLIKGHYGEIKAHLLEENGKIIVRKYCIKHGMFEDTLSIDPDFTRIQEERFYGRDFKTFKDYSIHDHGTSSIQYGRGPVLTIDLTNRCNMMCNPCFMDANQVGYVHELSFDDIKKILDDSLSFQPRRVAQVQFSGGEPTISPYFLDACRYAKKIGYTGIQAASNGLRFALEPGFAVKAAEAGLNLVYFQLDGVTNEANQHRHISNLFDLKKQAMENLFKAGIGITPVSTVVNGVNTEQIGPMMQFIIDNCDKIDAVSFQPVSFTGRDDEITDERRHAQRYTTSHLAKDLQEWSNGKIDIHRDWYPLGAGVPLTNLADHLASPADKWGGMCVSCHPDCGSCFYLVANKNTGEWATLTSFFNLDKFIKDVDVVTDSSRGKKLTLAQLALSIARNFDQSNAPKGFDFKELVKLIQYQFHGSLSDGDSPGRRDWIIIWAGGMWFQDLWTYDFRRTEMCSVPYGTQEGEITYCAYNTGIGWRQIVEHKHMNATTKDWFKEKGRHKIYAGERPVPIEVNAPSIKLRNYDEGCGPSCGCHGSSANETLSKPISITIEKKEEKTAQKNETLNKKEPETVKENEAV